MWRVLLTGATGFLGGELAVALSKTNSVEKIVCLVRAKNNEEAEERLQSVFALHQDPYDGKKLVALAGDLTDQRLPAVLSRHPLVADINLVVHAGANTSFLQQKISGCRRDELLGFPENRSVGAQPWVPGNIRLCRNGNDRWRGQRRRGPDAE
jgi:nucleoside-diphosphate-sugar epimerase